VSFLEVNPTSTGYGEAQEALAPGPPHNPLATSAKVAVGQDPMVASFKSVLLFPNQLKLIFLPFLYFTLPQGG